jgi:hypothetical protein
MDQQRRVTRQSRNAPVQHVQLSKSEREIPQNPMIGFRRHQHQQPQNPIFLFPAVEEENLNGRFLDLDISQLL